MRLALALTALLCLGCGSEHDHEGHAHGEQGDHADHAASTPAPAAAVAPAATAATAAPAGPSELALGAWTGRLEPLKGKLRLTVTDGDGKPVAATGEAKVVLSGVGQPEQRLVLAAAGNSWEGPGKAVGAPGYVAVVSVELGGHTESGRSTWGAVPEGKMPAPPAKDDHGHAHDGGGHDH